MTREIKLRAWDKLNKRFLSQKEMTEIGGFYYTYGVGPDDEFELMQYTGLKDKNGVEIYEGDIVKTNNLVYEIVYLAPQFFLRKNPNDNVDVESFSTPLVYEEIIGNIYENKDLLSSPDKPAKE